MKNSKNIMTEEGMRMICKAHRLPKVIATKEYEYQLDYGYDIVTKQYYVRYIELANVGERRTHFIGTDKDSFGSAVAKLCGVMLTDNDWRKVFE